jgi:DNA-directed RNA polymerase specialized sigma24 family protein
MDALTLDTIKAAQDNDLAATSEVINATEDRIAHLAYKMGASADQRDELAQVGRIAVWEGLARWNGNTVDSFFAFIHKTVQSKMQDAKRIEWNQGATGADHDALKAFATCLAEADGDTGAAERLCQTLPEAGRRLSAERAYAARVAWQGPFSIDKPHPETGTPYAELLPSEFDVPGDLIEPSDLARAQRDRKIKTVRAVIESMGAKQAHVLKATYGIDPVACLGTGAEADAELAATLDMQPKAVKTVRRQAHLSFENRYRKVTGMTA